MFRSEQMKRADLIEIRANDNGFYATYLKNRQIIDLLEIPDPGVTLDDDSDADIIDLLMLESEAGKSIVCRTN